jgi:hypothetical protein
MLERSARILSFKRLRTGELPEAYFIYFSIISMILHVYRRSVRKPEEEANPDVNGRAILKWILREIGQGGREWSDPTQNMDQSHGGCEHGNETSGSLKQWEILE